ncbi:MAG: carbon-nitrogen hydrolase family protein, partial [Gammaproteobacteria bacterium]|nr:carbon-nitrogen hydrolase family protein [Gammaproteobacteria bacterium]
MLDNKLRIGLAQIAPAWLDRARTLDKVASWISDAAEKGCDLVVFGEALVPGYPFWVERTNGAVFESALQKEMFAHYVSQGVCIEEGDLEPVCEVARRHNIAVYVGVMERAGNRGGHSLYCTMVFVDRAGTVASAHRKLMPTHEERLVWAIGDGNGLRTHKLGAFTV